MKSRTFKIILALIILVCVFPIYKGLSATMQARHASSPGTTLDDGLVGHWTFDGADMTSTTALDKSGNGNTGTLTNMSTSSRVAGVLGQGLQFDGVDDYVGVPGFNQTLSAATFSAWIYVNSKNMFDGFVFSRSTDIVGMNINALGNLGYHWTEAPCDCDWDSGLSIPIGRWVFVAITVESTKATAYLLDTNGSISSSVHSVSHPSRTLNNLQIGRDGYGGRLVDGNIDDVRVYNRALTADEIHQLYKMGEGTTMGVDPTSDPLAEGLAGYWKFDEASGTTSIDSSVNRNNGTLTNSPARTTGKIGGAINISNAGPDVVVTDTTALHVGNSFSYSVWIKPSSLPASNGVVFRKWANSQEDKNIYVNSAGKVGSGLYTTLGGSNLVGNVILTAGNWYHVVSMYDGTTRKIYVNGVLDNSQAFSGNVYDYSGDLIIGTDPESTSNYFPGDIDEFRAYNRALSADEVATLYRTTKPTEVDTSLVGHWTFDGPTISGTTVRDLSGAGNNGTLANGPTKTAGVLGQAVDIFPNDIDITAHITMGDPSSGILDIGSSDFAVSLFFKPRGYVSQGLPFNSILSKYDPWTPNSAGYGLRYSSSGILDFYVGNGSSSYVISSPGSITDNNWHHAVAMRSGSTMILYLDGVQVNSSSVSGSLSNNMHLQLGAIYTANNETGFKGEIDDVRIYNRSLTADEIYKMYKVGAGSKMNVDTVTPDLERGLAGYWPLDNGSGVTASDLSVNGNNGTLTGDPTWSNGKIGGAVMFDGTDDYIDTGINIRTLALSGSACFWMNPSRAYNSGTVDWILSQKAGGAEEFQIGKYDNNFLYFGFVYNDKRVIVPASSDNWQQGVWQHYCTTWVSAGGALKVYRNGSFMQGVASTEGTVFLDSSTLKIARFDGLSNYYAGSIDELRIYNRALSADEVATLYRTTIGTKASDGLVGYWPFNGPDVTDKVYDRSGAGNNGYFVGGATTSAKTIGQVGQGLQFDGVDDYALVGNNLAIGGTYSYSIGGWINTTNSSVMSIVEKYTYGSQAELYVNYVSNKASILLADGVDICAATSITSINDGRWHYVLGTRDFSNRQLKIFVDGNLEATQSDVLCDNANTTKFTSIGAGDSQGDGTLDGGFFSGILDEVRIYNRVLSAQEVKQLYNAGR